MSRARIVAVILTHNSGATLARVIDSCAGVAARTVVVDSGSQDATVRIARQRGCEILTHPFVNYSQQRNWAQRSAGLAPDDWVLHLDDEDVLTPDLAREIERAVRTAPADLTGFLMRRVSFFLGRPILHGHLNPNWHLRLFRASNGFCEDRLYDQHFVTDGKTRHLKGLMLDLQEGSLEDWTSAHNRWSTAEALEAGRSRRSGEHERRTLQETLQGDLRMKKRWIKNRIWYRSPLFLRSVLFFLYSYVLRLGFLDGREGLTYSVLQCFWFRFLVDAKLLEARMAVRNAPGAPTGAAERASGAGHSVRALAIRGTERER
jgi:glycosyltransferase involved in cell wall biosynthesis